MVHVAEGHTWPHQGPTLKTIFEPPLVRPMPILRWDGGKLKNVPPFLGKKGGICQAPMDPPGGGDRCTGVCFSGKVSPKVGTRVTNFITPPFQDLDADGKRKTGCQFSAQRAKKEEVAVIHHERVFEVKDCASVLSVFSLPSNGSTAWTDPYYGFTTPFFYTSATVVAWPLHSADPLIGSGVEPIESPEWEGFNESIQPPD